MGAELFITTCWFIWNYQNKISHIKKKKKNKKNKIRAKEAVVPLDKLSDLAQQHLEEYQHLHHQATTKGSHLEATWPEHLENKLWPRCFWRIGSSRYWSCGSKLLRWSAGSPVRDHPFAIFHSCCGNHCSLKGSHFYSRTRLARVIWLKTLCF